MPSFFTRYRLLRVASVLAVACLLGGCATASRTPDPRDPWEPFNRGVYEFNEQVDRFVMKPAAEAYRFVLHPFVRQSVSNFFSNIGDIRVTLNNALQGKFTTAYSDFGRLAINSTLGVFGLFDIASEAGVEKHQEDFGQTLGWWGIRDGPFLMLPFFGASTVRDAFGFGVDYLTDPVTYVDPSSTRYELFGTQFVNRRSELLEAKKVLEGAALDEYEFVRDAYLQRRRSLVHDGKPPADKDTLAPPLQKDSAPAKPALEKKE